MSTIYTLYYPDLRRHVLLLATGAKYVYCYATAEKIKEAIRYLELTAYVDKQPISYGTKIATFTSYDDFVTNYPELLL